MPRQEDPYVDLIENLDLNFLPSVLVHHANQTVTYGDMHGNVLKLLFLLMVSGIINRISPEEYEALKNIVLTKSQPSTLTPDDLVTFNKILQLVTPCYPRNCDARFLGDTLADRIGNDEFTLEVFKRLDEIGVNFEIMFSNHDMSLLLDYYRKTKDWQRMCGSKEISQQGSKDGLQELIEKGMVKHSKIIELVETHVIPHLKIISYILSPDKNHIELFMHAPNGGENIKKLAAALGVVFKGESLAEFIDTINQININFQLLIKNKPEFEKKMIEGNPIFDFIWNRDDKIDLSPYPFVSHVNYGHMHIEDFPEPNPDKQRNFDNLFGIDPEYNKNYCCWIHHAPGRLALNLNPSASSSKTATNSATPSSTAPAPSQPPPTISPPHRFWINPKSQQTIEIINDYIKIRKNGRETIIGPSKSAKLLATLLVKNKLILEIYKGQQLSEDLRKSLRADQKDMQHYINLLLLSEGAQKNPIPLRTLIKEALTEGRLLNVVIQPITTLLPTLGTSEQLIQDILAHFDALIKEGSISSGNHGSSSTSASLVNSSPP